MKRIYHHYKKCEEFKAGMWRTIAKQKNYNDLLEKAIQFTSNAELYGEWMLKVIEKWKYSCEYNLSCQDMNRQAWIGHAACCLALGCPEDITRLAWHHLTEEQQNAANKKADEAISLWESRNKIIFQEKQSDLFYA